MNDKIFIDTNIWVYLYSRNSKSHSVNKFIESNFDRIVISTQVLNEFFNVLAIKLKLKSKEGVKDIIQDLIYNFTVSVITTEIIINAIDISIKYQFNFFDGLIIASAMDEGCTQLITEDMQDGQVINNTLTLVNPFLK